MEDLSDKIRKGRFYYKDILKSLEKNGDRWYFDSSVGSFRKIYLLDLVKRCMAQHDFSFTNDYKMTDETTKKFWEVYVQYEHRVERGDTNEA